MFGPNSVPQFHHRQPEYKQLLRTVRDQTARVFGLDGSWSLCFLTGSGTLANEAVVSSALQGRMWFDARHGEFLTRLKKLCAAYRWGHSTQVHEFDHQMMVRYETAESRVNSVPFSKTMQGIRFADCISAAPYYLPPSAANVFTWVSGKQLGTTPGISVVGVQEAAWKYFEGPARYSYLNLRRYEKAFTDDSWSPHTPALKTLVKMREALEEFSPWEVRTRCDKHRKILAEAMPSASWIGSSAYEGPVVTVPHAVIPKMIAQTMRLYPGQLGWQFFLYSGTTSEYEQFAELLRKERDNGRTQS